MARILILTPQLPYPPQSLTGFSQGTTIRNFNLLAGLARRHTVDLLTFLAPEERRGKGAGEQGQRGEENADPAALLAPYCRHVVTELAPARTSAQRGRDTLLSPLPDMALRLEKPEMHGHLARLLDENSYDVIQVEGIEMAPYALALLETRFSKAAGTRPRLVFDDHNAEYLLQRRAFATDVRRPRRWLGAIYSLIQWQKLARYERRICRAADRVVAVSEADRDALQRLLPGLDVTVIPNGVDLDFYHPGVVPPQPGLGPHTLVFTGKMDYRPNVDAVLWFVDQVLPDILAQVPDAHLLVVGQRPHARLAPLAVHPAVTVTGRVPDVRPYIAAAGVYVVPLRIGGGTRLKVLEAMAMGQAIVSTRLGCDGFAFEDGREVCFADEPAAFADAVVGLLEDREQAATLGRVARAYVEAHCGWDAIVPRLEKVYSTMVRSQTLFPQAGGFLTRKTKFLSGHSWRQRARLLGLRLVAHLYPKPPGPTEPPRSILLIRPDHLGDMLFLTPTLHALRTALPDARITLLVGPWSQDVLQNNPDLDAMVTCRFPGFERQPKTSALAPYRLLRQMARDLRRGGYDTAVVLRFDHWWGAWLAAAAGIPRRVGYAWPETVPFLTEAVPYLPNRHEVEQDGTLLAALSPGLARRLGPTRYVVAQTDRDWAAAWLRDHGVNPGQRLVAIHPGAGAAVKQWPIASWAEVADRLIEDSGVQVLLTGSTGERSLNQALADAMAHPVLDAAGETSLGQLAALQARCALVLGSDCGPLHLAVAVDVPTVHLYGPVASAKFGPWGDPARHVVLATNWPCAPCNRLDWPAEVLAQHACMAAITPAQVLAFAEMLLGKSSIQPGP